MHILLVAALFAYTLALVVLGRMGLRKDREAGAFVMANRRLTGPQVFVLVTAMWSSWIYITEVDTAYSAGISAMWFGVAVIVMSLVVAALFVTPFRRLGFVTNSGLLGGAFGSYARTISALVIALTFPIFALGNVVAAAAFLHSLLGWSLVEAEVAALAVIVAYVAFGGLLSLVYTQAVNLVVMAGGMLAVFAWSVTQHGIAGGAAPSAWHIPPFAVLGIGFGPVLVWLFSDLVNVVSAQVEFQAVTAVRDPRTARQAVYWSTGGLVVFTAVAAFLGMASRGANAGLPTGILAYPILVLGHAPVAIRILGTLSVWAAALTWTAPLLFSGATSLGLDVAQPILRDTTAERTRWLVRWGLPIEALLLLGYTLLRPGELAWWSVLALTIRNGAIFAPTIGLLLWPYGGKRAAALSMLVGVLGGLAWNALTGFSTVRLAYGLNPAWVGTSLGILVFIAGSWIENRGAVRWQWPHRLYGWLAWAVCLPTAGLLAVAWTPLSALGLAGPAILGTAVALELGTISCLRAPAAMGQARGSQVLDA